MLLRQFVDDDLGCGSYLVGDVETGDPRRGDPAFAIQQYLAGAPPQGVRITRVLETHTHADHLSGHGRFALEHGLPTSIHPLARPEYAFDPLDDGQVLRVGSVEVRVVHTPGHRPEHCAFVVGDELVLTGDSLFVGDAARPDLAIDAREGATALHRSLRRLAELPDPVVVYPGHVSGSLCGTNMSDDHSSSIGRERKTNHALRTKLADFVDESASLTAPKPPTTEHVVALNRGPWVGARPPLHELDSAGETLVLDVRPVDVFAAGHLPGAISVALDGGSFATRAAFVLGRAEPVVLHAQSRAEADEAARLLHAVGLFEQRGFVRAEGRARLQTVPVQEVNGRMQMLDVREESEEPRTDWLTVPYRLLRIAPPDLDPSSPVFTICASGARATLAASLLVRQGFDARPVVGGGVADL